VAESFVETNLIYKVVAGSQAFGLDTPESDLDTRGVCIPPVQYLLGLTPFEQWEGKTDAGDAVVYGLPKFVRLALACNPNIIETLYTAPEHVLFINDYGRRLVEHRHLFLTRRAGETFAEYAISQLRRLERHHRWLVCPPAHPPTPEDFGGWAAGGRYKFPDHDAQRAYQDALKHWKLYQKWLRDRNPARADLERRFGYDTKHAMHLLRLLRMGIEILETGQVHVHRPDREWLRAVREGLLSYEELLALASQYEARLGQLRETSTLPAEPDAAAAETLVVELQERFICESRQHPVP
jgi:predicted nucleotidyltransferase